jgi:hypothetical protein
MVQILILANIPVENFEIIPGCGRVQSRKTLIPEQARQTISKIPELGEWNFLESSGLGTGTLNKVSKSKENSELATI